MAVVMSFATVMSVSADEREDLASAGASQDVETAAADGNVSVGAGTDTEATGTSGLIYLEKPNWAGATFSIHIWEAKQNGATFFAYGGRKEHFEEKDGKLVYDLSKLNESTTIKGGLKAGVTYNLMVYTDVGVESCGLMFNTDCVGDTIRVTSNERSFENTEDSAKHSYPIAWTKNAKKYGIPLQITSVGTVQGEFVTKGSSPDDIIKAWDKNYKQYPNKASFSPQSSARDHKTRLAEIKAEFKELVSKGKVLVFGGGVYTENTDLNKATPGSSSGSSSDSSSKSSSNSSSKKIYKDKNGNTVTRNADGSYTDENGNKVDASDVTATTETTDTVTTGESATPIYIGLGVMLAAAGVYFLTRKKKEA